MISQTKTKAWPYKFGVDSCVSIAEAMKRLSLSRTSVYKLCENGRLRKGQHPTHDKSVKGKVVICLRSLNEYLESIEK